MIEEVGGVEILQEAEGKGVCYETVHRSNVRGYFHKVSSA